MIGELRSSLQTAAHAIAPQANSECSTNGGFRGLWKANLQAQRIHTFRPLYWIKPRPIRVYRHLFAIEKSARSLRSQLWIPIGRGDLAIIDILEPLE